MKKKIIILSALLTSLITTTSGCTRNIRSSIDVKDGKNLGIIPVIDETNNTLTYGLYPQTHVSNETTISALDALTTSPESNGWYLYNDEYYAKKTANPHDSNYTFNDGTVICDGSEYWFICEPIEWKILTSSNGSYSLVSTVLLDAHRFDSCSKYYMNSEIRSFLNDDFLNSAFNLDSSLIQITTVDNSPSTTNMPNFSYTYENTEDKIYLLSYKDYLNTDYGFSTRQTRECKSTDYARANGVECSKNPSYFYNGYYWTRSLYSTMLDDGVCIVFDSGDLYFMRDSYYYSVSYAYLGVRPAMTIKI